MTDLAGRLRVVVLGYLVRGPFGGMAWHHLQYVAGLEALGHEVLFIEDSGEYDSCYDPERQAMTNDPAAGLRFAEAAFAALGLGPGWAYFDAHRGRWLGPAASRSESWCRSADVVLNVSGVNPVRPWWEEVPIRVLIDTDPGFTQVRHLQDPGARALAAHHTCFFSFGESIGLPGCSVPDDGLPWRPTRQPVVPAMWEVTPGPAGGRFTTVMQWDSYRAVEHGGRRFGMKSDSFAPYMDLPRRSSQRFELAVGSPTAPRGALRGAGWSVSDPSVVARTPPDYRRWIRKSKAEFSVAKAAYVETGSGWFSERSAGYLASGRPVLVQDTGFSEHLPTGTGIVGFRSPEEAVAGAAAIDRAYDDHCAAARDLAVTHFGAPRVLGSLLEEAARTATSR